MREYCCMKSWLRALSDAGLGLAGLAAAGALAAGCMSAPASRAHLHLLISQRVSLYDVPLDIRVSGVPPGDKVTLRLESSNSQWSAQATFEPQQPVLNLRSTAPVSGSYRGVNGMGLFESLTPRRQSEGLLTGTAGTFTLTASAQGSTATIALTRELTGPGVTCTRSTVSGHGFYGLYCAPAPHTQRRAAVLVFGGSEGGLFTARTAELLASRGFPALALAYFDEPGLPQALDRIPLEYFTRAVGWLGQQPGVDAGALTVWGDSRGSEAALLLGAYFPALVHAVIAGSPSSVINGAVSLVRPVPPSDPAWTVHGKPLPIASPYGAPYSPGNPAAVIPVQKIRGPVLLLVGADDQLWPSQLYAQAIMTSLGASHDPYPHQELLFPGAGHAVGAAFPYDLGTASVTEPAGTLHLGGTPVANSAAGTKAWQDVLTFLHRLTRQ